MAAEDYNLEGCTQSVVNAHVDPFIDSGVALRVNYGQSLDRCSH